jgi:hypothetical protein
MTANYRELCLSDLQLARVKTVQAAPERARLLQEREASCLVLVHADVQVQQESLRITKLEPKHSWLGARTNGSERTACRKADRGARGEVEKETPDGSRPAVLLHVSRPRQTCACGVDTRKLLPSIRRWLRGQRRQTVELPPASARQGEAHTGSLPRNLRAGCQLAWRSETENITAPTGGSLPGVLL